MYICVGCKIEMRCDKNGVGADFGHGHVYPSDRFRCPECGCQILATNSLPCQDPTYKMQREYLQIRQPSDTRKEKE